MPELPEAETIARELNQNLAGCVLGNVSLTRTDVVHGDPRPLSELLPGRRVIKAYRRAKRVILELDGPDGCVELVFRLGMSGRLTVCDQEDPLASHTHLRISIKSFKESKKSMTSARELRFRDPRRFGGLWVLTGHSNYPGKKLGPVGIEPLEVNIRTFRTLMNRSRQIKALLMDQIVIAGLGNIYCDESLHAAGVHPLRKANSLNADEMSRLFRAIRSVLRKAIRFEGTTLVDYRRPDGEWGSFQQHHRVYQRHGKPCKRCGETIERITAAGRTTCFCPKCQPIRANFFFVFRSKRRSKGAKSGVSAQAEACGSEHHNEECSSTSSILM